MTDIKLVTNADTGTADIVGGDDWDDMATKVNSFANTPTPSFRIYKAGSTYYAQNGVTKAITSGADCGALVNTCLATLTTTGGIIHFVSGTYDIVTQITVPQHTGVGIVLEGEGWRNTLLQWTASADASKYIIESYSTNSSGWQAVTFDRMQISGGASTSDRRVHGLHIGRENASAVAHYTFHDFRVRNSVTAQIVAHFVQDSYWYFVHCESLGSTPSSIIDLAIDNASHINLLGCNIGAITVDESFFNATSCTLEYLEYKVNLNYVSHISSCFFDPVPTGLTHQIKVGTTGNVVGVTFDNVEFSQDTNTVATDRYFYIDNATNTIIRTPKFKTGSTVDKFIEITSNANGTVVYYPNQESTTKIVNNGVNSIIYSPHPTGMTIVAATNTITDTSAASGDFLKHDGTRFVRNIPKTGANLFLLRGTTIATGTNSVQYFNLDCTIVNATETIVDLILDYAITVKRFRIMSHANAKTANTIVALRDDAADVGAITIATGVTGELDSGALSTVIASGSKINWKIDTSASASGAITIWGWVEYEVLLQ